MDDDALASDAILAELDAAGFAIVAKNDLKKFVGPPHRFSIACHPDRRGKRMTAVVALPD
jgi:hypothetical protein